MERYEAIKAFVESNKVKVRSFAEIGAYQGECSEHLLSYWPESTAYLIDPWLPYDPGRGLFPLERFKSKEANEKIYQSVLEKFSGMGNVVILRNTSEEAAGIVPDGLDLAFIDGRHDYEFAKQDIELWKPKIRSGGILCGHDYGHPWKGVIRAVNEAFVKPNLLGVSVWGMVV